MCDVSNDTVDLEKVRKGDALLDEAEQLREESEREKRQLSPEDLENIYMGERRQTYTVSEAAELTGYHPESIRRHIRDDKLKAAQTGKGNYRISRPELARWWREELGGGELFEELPEIQGVAIDAAINAIDRAPPYPEKPDDQAWDELRDALKRRPTTSEQQKFEDAYEHAADTYRSVLEDDQLEGPEAPCPVEMCGGTLEPGVSEGREGLKPELICRKCWGI